MERKPAMPPTALLIPRAEERLSGETSSYTKFISPLLTPARAKPENAAYTTYIHLAPPGAVNAAPTNATEFKPIQMSIVTPKPHLSPIFPIIGETANRQTSVTIERRVMVVKLNAKSSRR